MSEQDPAGLAARLAAADEDPPPAGLLAAARAAFSWRTLDTDLCRPSYDSLLDEALTPVRGGVPEARLLRFELGDLALDLEVTALGDSRSLVGHITPATTAELTVRHGGEVEAAVSSDEHGRFVLDEVRPGPFSVRCGALHTDWVLI